jgi:hypothetical protein
MESQASTGDFATEHTEHTECKMLADRLVVMGIQLREALMYLSLVVGSAAPGVPW